MIDFAIDFAVSPYGEPYLRELQRGDFVERSSAEVFGGHFDVDFGADDTLFVLVGSDSGLLPRWLIRRGIGQGSAALFVELDELCDPVLDQLGGALDDEEIELCAATEAADRLTVEAIGQWLYGGKVVLVESMGCYLGRSERYTELRRVLSTLLGERAHCASAQLSGKRFIEASIRNLAENRLPASSVGRIGQGRTAVVLGGGPSLDEHLDWIRENRDQVFVLAVSRIVERLNSACIEPDAVVAVDPQDLLYDISKNALELSDVLLVGAYHVVPPLLQQWPGPHVYLGRSVSWESKLADDADNFASPGSTVTHAALWTAFSWGFSQILLSGFDLCFAPGGSTHASGSLESLCADLPVNYTAQVTTYSGRRAGTSTGLKLARDELESMGEHMARNGTAVFNLAADAARVDSIAHTAPERIVLIGERPSLDVRRDRQADRSHWLALRKELADASRGLRALRSACSTADTLLDKLHGRGAPAQDPTSKRKLDRLERRMNTREGRWMELVKRYGVLELVGSIAPRGFDLQSDEELEEWGRNYYRIIDRNAKHLLMHISNARERVERRLDEHAETVDVPALLAYWDRDGTPGRSRFAIDHGTLDEASKRQVAAAELRFATHLADTDTRYAKGIEGQKTNVADLLRTIALLFNEKERDDLALLAQAFDRHGERYAVLADWAFGQLAELDGDPQAAMQCYFSIVSHHASLHERQLPVPFGQAPVLENALLRTAELQLGSDDPAQALQTLALLTELSVAHAPRQARMLALLGRHEQAIALLHTVLDNEVCDWRVAALLSSLYEQSGSVESAAIAHTLSQRMREQPDGAPPLAEAA